MTCAGLQRCVPPARLALAAMRSMSAEVLVANCVRCGHLIEAREICCFTVRSRTPPR
jgi:hypothetical protein